MATSKSMRWLRCCFATVLVAVGWTATAVAQTNVTSSAYLQLRWSGTDVVRVTTAEPLLRSALQSFFATAEAPRVLDVREETFAATLDTAMSSTFLVLFNVTTNSTATATNSTATATNSTATATNSTATAANSTATATNSTATATNNTAIGIKSIDGLVSFLKSGASVGSSKPSAGDNTLATAASTTLLSTASLSVKWLALADVQLLGPFPATAALPTPTLNYMLLRVFFRNVRSPESLPRGLIYQARQGIARFLNLTAIADVVAAGPPEATVHSVLQVAQRYYLLLRGGSSGTNGTNGGTIVTLAMRERVANLLMYGDPWRQVADSTANDGYFATLRASMFIDYIVPVTTVPLSVPDPTAVAAMDAHFAFAFSSLTIEQFPAGNPPAPALPTSSSTTAGISTDALVAKLRKRHRFVYDEAAFAASASTLPTTVAYPSETASIDATAASACTMLNGYCTYVYWTNALARSFWVERIESVHRVAWNLFPATPFFAAADPTPTLVAPVVAPGRTATPIWTFGALSGPANRLDVTLHLRSVGDANATALTVAIRTDVRSPTDATSVVTSIARDTIGATTPVFATASNVVVTYESRFRRANELFLFLELKTSSVVAKDTAQPCAHCARLFDWCAQQRACAALASCIFLEGLDTDQVPAAMLQAGAIHDVRDVAPFFRKCLVDTNSATADGLRALLLFASAVRCQMQRLCPFRTASYYGGSAATILVWESTDAHQQLRTTANNTHFSATAVNVSMRLGSETLCYLPIRATTTADALQETIMRTCRFPTYLGRVAVSVNMTGANASASAATSYDSVDIRYKYVVGPLPTLAIVPPTANATVVPPAVEIATLALPGIRLRVETDGFQSILPPAPVVAAPDPCAACDALALDGCLRDLTCVAFTDCILRFSLDNTSATTTGAATASRPLLSDIVLDAFERRAVGSQIAFTTAVDACHAATDVNLPAWRKLVNASACYSKRACPISLRRLVPMSTSVAGLWRVAPSQKLQKLLYQQQNASEAPTTTATTTAVAWPRVPLQLVRGADVVQTDTSAPDTLELAAKLRQLLAFNDIAVTVEFDRVDAASQLRSVQWSITYSHWAGRLPRFIADARAPQWTLFTFPSSLTSPDELVLDVVQASETVASGLPTIAV